MFIPPIIHITVSQLIENLTSKRLEANEERFWYSIDFLHVDCVCVPPTHRNSSALLAVLS
jgi:hypothetical protein